MGMKIERYFKSIRDLKTQKFLLYQREIEATLVISSFYSLYTLTYQLTSL